MFEGNRKTDNKSLLNILLIEFIKGKSSHSQQF